MRRSVVVALVGSMVVALGGTAQAAPGDLRTYVLRDGDRSFGSAVRIELREVTQLRLRDVRRGTTYVADF